MAVVEAPIIESFWLRGRSELVVLIQQVTPFSIAQTLGASIDRLDGTTVQGTAKKEFLLRHAPGGGAQELEAFRLKGIDKANAPVGAVLKLDDEVADPARD